MKTYDLLDEGGRLFAFEVSVLETDRRGICRVVQSIPGANLIRKPKLFSWFREEEFCEFEVDGEKFVAWEPYGDNSRYWIGPDPARWLPQTQRVRDSFAAVGASRLFRWLGFVLGTFLLAVGVLIFANGSSGSWLVQAFIGVALGAYFINYGVTGRQTFWARRERD